MARLGDAIMDALGGDPPDRSIADTVRYLIDRYGSQQRAADALDVPRRTLRGWAEGKDPRMGGGWLRDIAREFGREERLRDRGERRADGLGTRSASDRTKRGTENRTVPIGNYLREGTVERVRDLYLGGADADELGRAFHAGIDDRGFYAETFDPDDWDGHWDIDWIDLDEGEIGGTYVYE